MRTLSTTLCAALVALGLTRAAAEAQPQAQDGTKLLEVCTSPEVVLKANCAGYLAGVQNTLSHLAAAGLLPNSPCISEAVTATQLAAVVVKYITEHPKDRHYNAASLVDVALHEAWPPCDAPKK